MSTLNSTFQSQVDSAIQNLDTVSVNINYSNMSKSVLDQKFDLNISDEMLSAMSDLFISLSGTELKADQVNLYDFSGYVLQAGLSTMVKKSDDSHNKWIQKAREALKAGDKVITAGGIYGKIKEIGDTYMLIEISDGVRIRVDKTSVFASAEDAQQK